MFDLLFGCAISAVSAAAGWWFRGAWDAARRAPLVKEARFRLGDAADMAREVGVTDLRGRHVRN